MHTFWIVLITLAVVTTGLKLLIPFVVKYRLKRFGIDRPVSTYRKRVTEEEKRYIQRIKEIDDETNGLVTSIVLAPVIVLTGISFIAWTWKPLLLLIPLCLLYQIPFILKNLFSKHIKTYLLIDEKALVVISEYHGMHLIDWKLNDEALAKYMKLPLMRSDYLKELDAFSDSAIHLVKLRETLEAARYQDTGTLSDEKKEAHTASVKKHKERYEELKNELFDVDKVWKYSIGVLEQPGIDFLNKEFEKKENQEVNEPVVSHERISPAIEALMKLAQDPQVDESLRKYAMDTIRDIHQKEQEEKEVYQSEFKKDDAISTIRAARQMHHLEELPVDKQ